MTNKTLNNWKKYCSEPLELVENYAAAKADNFAGWCIHHKLEIKKDGTRVSVQELKDQGLYFGRPAEELVFMRTTEHARMHMTGLACSITTRQKISKTMTGILIKETTRLKISESLKGRTLSEEHCKNLSAANLGDKNPFFGKHHSEETRQKLSQSLKGKNTWTKGSHWWNNGISSTHSRECPGEGWTRGRLSAKFKY